MLAPDDFLDRRIRATMQDRSTSCSRVNRLARSGRRPLAVALLIVAGLGVGCRAHERSYPGVAPETVWTAARAAAESPDYAGATGGGTWLVDQNDVQADRAAGRLEIHRRLSRLQRRPQGDRFIERRQWTVGVQLDADPLEPTLRFVSRGFAVPAHVREEAERFFDQVAIFVATPGGTLPVAPAEDAGPLPAP